MRQNEYRTRRERNDYERQRACRRNERYEQERRREYPRYERNRERYYGRSYIRMIRAIETSDEEETQVDVAEILTEMTKLKKVIKQAEKTRLNATNRINGILREICRMSDELREEEVDIEQMDDDYGNIYKALEGVKERLNEQRTYKRSGKKVEFVDTDEVRIYGEEEENTATINSVKQDENDKRKEKYNG